MVLSQSVARQVNKYNVDLKNGSTKSFPLCAIGIYNRYIARLLIQL